VRILAIAALTTFVWASASDAAPLAQFPPTKWSCDLGNQKVLQGINAGLIGEGWRMTSNDKKGHLVAEIVVRSKHTLVIDITYTDSTYELRYKSSENLKYQSGDGGVPQIHNNANKWLRKLHKAISLQLDGLCNL
jgi:hypothetical protein